MSHLQQLNFINSVKLRFPASFFRKKVLEVGSLNINGTVRIFFTECDYTGIDVGEGPDVDLVCPGQELNHPDNTYDTTLSCECFEHNPYWKETFLNMHRMTKPGGLIIMTCATIGRLEHGTTRTSPADSPLTIGKGWDYYCNLTADDLKQNFNLDEMFTKYDMSVDMSHCDLYFYGTKR